MVTICVHLIHSAFSAEIAMHMDYNKTIILIQSDGMKGNYNCYRLLTRMLMMRPCGHCDKDHEFLGF